MKNGILILVFFSLFSCNYSKEDLEGSYVNKNKFTIDSLVLKDGMYEQYLFKNSMQQERLYYGINRWKLNSYNDVVLDNFYVMRKSDTSVYSRKFSVEELIGVGACVEYDILGNKIIYIDDNNKFRKVN